LLVDLGVAYRDFGDYKKAIDSFEEAIQIAKEKGEKESEGTLYVGIGYVYECLGRYQEAKEFYEFAMGILKPMFGSDNPYVKMLEDKLRIINYK
jgi:tetratricopeptide (TPR) repeat protein